MQNSEYDRWRLVCSAKNFKWRFFIESTSNRFCIFFLSFVTVCFFPVVILLTSSREKNDLNVDLSVAAIPSCFFLWYLQTFSFPSFLHLLLENPKTSSAILCSLYFFRILLVTIPAIICLSLSLFENAYLVRTSSATAVWNNKVFFKDVPEICRINLLTFDLGDGWSFLNRWSRFLYFSARCSTLFN